MRVLMFGWEFPPHISGGLGTACYGMTQGLLKKNTQVIFVLPTLPHGNEQNSGISLRSASGTPIYAHMHEKLDLGEQHIWHDNLREYRLSSLLFAYDTEESYLARQQWKSMSKQDISYVRTWSESSTYTLQGGYGPDLMAEVYRYSRLAGSIALQEDFDVIHVHDWMTYPAGMLAKTLTGKPLIAHIHATEYDRSGENVNSVVAEMERAGLHAADKVIAVSHLTKSMIMKHYQVPEHKIFVVHNAVARHEVEHQFNYLPRVNHEKWVLFLGRVTFQKGPGYFIEVAKMVLEKEKNVRFFMAGAGDMLPTIIRRAGQLGIGNRFHFTGFLRGEDVDKMFALSDLYVMPSVSEPFGITPLEAMLYDVPVLLSRQSGVSEVLQHALKADFWDTRDMADKICAVLRYPALAKSLVTNCKEELKNLRWENVADQLNQIYTASMAGAH